MTAFFKPHRLCNVILVLMSPVVFTKRSHAEKKTLLLLVFSLLGSGFRKLGVRNTCLLKSLSLRKKMKKRKGNLNHGFISTILSFTRVKDKTFQDLV